MIDFKALKGDTTDNIPGIAGVGDKTAAELLQDYGSLDGVYEHIDEVKPEKLREKLARAPRRRPPWRELVTIDRDVPIELDLEPARLGDYDRNEVLRLFREYEFRIARRAPARRRPARKRAHRASCCAQADRSAPIPAAQVAGRPSARATRAAWARGAASS